MPPITSRPTQRIILGIDPGKSGAVCALYPQGGLGIKKMPTTDYALWDIISEYGRHGDEGGGYTEVLAVLEKIDPRPTHWYDRKANRWTHSILKSTCLIYGHYCACRAILVSEGIPLKEVRPQDWITSYGLSKGKMKDSEWKNKLADFARLRYPGAKIPVYAADSVLLAHYGSKLLQEDPGLLSSFGIDLPTES